jgi:hypothetical protein
MNKDIHDRTDFDAWVRRKLIGGEFEGKPKTGVMLKELHKVMINSVLSGPKTPMRAIMGTGSATFLRPMSQVVGAALRLPFTGDVTTLRSSLAQVNAIRESIPEAFDIFKTRLNSYWAGDVATIKSRFMEVTKGDEQWEVLRHHIENSGRATPAETAAFYTANMARQLNDNRYLTYSTKIMAATDDTFSHILQRARAKELAVREALEANTSGRWIELDPPTLRDAETRFLNKITDADGNILDKSVEFAKGEVTLTTDLTGFSKGLNDVFNATPWAKPFFLFARTGVNGLALTAKHTPGFNFLVKEWNDIHWAKPNDLSSVSKYGIKTAEDLANAKALQGGRLAIGSSVITMASMHFLNGGLTGNGPTDRRKNQVWKDARWHPRSINIGGVWVGYDSFEPFNQILAGIADVGDHSQLMGEEWTKDQFQKMAMVVAQTATSKSYLQSLQGFVDLFTGKPGQQNRVIAGLMNNQIPLAGLRNDIGKLFTPHMKELSSGWADAIRNRNLLFERFPGEDLPIKYDLLNGKPIKEWDPITRMWNAFIPVSFNLDYSEGRNFLFRSGYDLRMSTYYSPGPNSINLTDSPMIRSKYQKAIGDLNLEKELTKLSRQKKVIESILQMEKDIRDGNRGEFESKDYYHNKMIGKVFTRARKQAWLNIQGDELIQELSSEQIGKKLKRKQKTAQTSFDEVLTIYK